MYHKQNQMKRISTFSMVVCLAAVAMAQIPQNGLVAHFNLNGQAGFSSTVQGKTINPNNYTSDTKTGGATKPGNMQDRYSETDSAAYFAYTSYQYAMEDLSGNSNSLLKLKRPMSFGAWVLMVTPDFTYNQYPILFGAIGPSDVTYGFQINLSSNPAVYMVLNSNSTLNSLGRNIGSDPYGSVSDFRHVMGTWDTDDTMRFYYQGKLVGQKKFSGDSLKYEKQTNNHYYFAMGGQFTSNGWNGRCFNGALDDVVLYNRALSATEIWNLFNSTSKCTNSNNAKSGHLYQTVYAGKDILQIADSTTWHNDQCEFDWYLNNTYAFTTYGYAQSRAALSQNGTYKVKVINKSTRCWYWTNDVVVTNQGGTNATITFANAHISVYPNPVENLLHISAAETIRSIQIVNAIGEIVYQKQGAATESIDTRDWSSGIYTILAVTDNGTASSRVIKP